MEVTFLGTGASWPTKERGMSALIIKRGGDAVLFDCGEGTQRQLQHSDVSYQAINQVYLTHYHGDHCYGLPGLIKTMALNEREKPLDLYGPKGLLKMVDAWKRMGGWTHKFPINVLELAAGDVIDRSDYTITAYQGDHSVSNLAFALQEPDRPGKFDKPKALELGVKPGPSFGKLQKGIAVELEDGTTITPEQILGPGRPGRRVVFSGDSQPCQGLLDAAKDACVFICEASFTKDLIERAREVKHMCAFEAAGIAAGTGVWKLILTHISPRYKDPNEVLDEAKYIFENTEIAADLWSFTVPYPGNRDEVAQT
jgi:ribonuclease Z